MDSVVARPMVDIHSHLLPNLDDGPQSWDESVRMLEIAAAAGTTHMVATPHASTAFPYREPSVRDAFEELNLRNTTGIHLHLGCDFHLTFENVVDALANPKKYTINNGRYLLVEVSDLVAPHAARQILKQLLAARITPILTHPERNLSLQFRCDELKRWVEDGCLLQVTGGSFLGHFGKSAQRAAQKLMKAKLVHVVASDSHDHVRRHPDLRESFTYIAKHYGRYCAERVLLTNPSAICTGANIPQPRTRTHLFSWLTR